MIVFLASSSLSLSSLSVMPLALIVERSQDSRAPWQRLGLTPLGLAGEPDFLERLT